MARKIKHYKVGLDSDTLAISLVDYPAIEMPFVFLKKESEQLVKLANEERHLLVGAALVPDKPIYRNQDGEEFYMTFDKDVIRKMAYDYLANDRNNNVTLQHQDATNGVQMVESWIKEGENDKSDYYGLQAPIGSWIVTMKVNDPKIWDGVKKGEFNGFSVESVVSLEDLKINKIKDNMAKEDIKMETVEITDNFWQKLKDIIANALKSQPADEQEAETKAEDAVEDVKEDVEPVMEEVNNADEEVVESGSSNVEEASQEAADTAAEIVESAATDPNEAADGLQQVIDNLQAEIDALKSENEELKKKASGLSKEVEKMSKEPSIKPVVKKGENKVGDTRDILAQIANRTYFK